MEESRPNGATLVVRIQRIVQDQSGADAAEYIVIVGLIALVLGLNIRSFGAWLHAQFLQAADLFGGGAGMQENFASAVPASHIAVAGQPVGFWITVAAITVPCVFAGVSWWRRG